MSPGSRWVFFKVETKASRPTKGLIYAVHDHVRYWMTKPSRKLKRITVSVLCLKAGLGLPPTYVTIKVKTTKRLTELWREGRPPPSVRVYEESDIEQLASSLEKTHAIGN